MPLTKFPNRLEVNIPPTATATPAKIYAPVFSMLNTPHASPLDLLDYLYGVEIIENTWKDSKTERYMHRSIFRNEGDFDRNLQLRIVPAVWNGLTV